MTALVIILCIIVLPVLYNLLFPLKPPSLENYFQVGQTYSSKMEGITQTIIKTDKEKVYSEVTLKPGAVGPPEHLHLGFDESATITKGTITVVVNKKTFELKAGDRITVKRGEYHTFSNKSSETAIITCNQDTDFVPVTFAYALAQFYPIMDSTSKLKMVHFFFKMSVLGELFDSYVADAPVNAQKIIKKILKPYARVLGYKLYDIKSTPLKT